MQKEPTPSPTPPVTPSPTDPPVTPSPTDPPIEVCCLYDDSCFWYCVIELVWNL